MKTIYIKYHPSGAGKWIYKAYFDAWKSVGFLVQWYNNIEHIILDSSYENYLMALDYDIIEKNPSILSKFDKVYLHCLPNILPYPYCTHPNFVSSINKQQISQLNEMQNVIKWTFSIPNKEYYTEWKNMKSVLLAFDNINYRFNNIENKYEYDFCFIGSRANNGFDEKIKIMNLVFRQFAEAQRKNNNLKFAFFIDKNISHEKEEYILSHSRIALNIHDQYQRILKTDTNERTFKSLALCGILYTDNVGSSLDGLTGGVFKYDNIPSIQSIIDMLDIIKEEPISYYKEYTLTNHTYINRVKQLLEY